MKKDDNLESQSLVILNSISDGVFTIDRNWKITFFNKAAEKITGVPSSQAVGKYCWEVFRASICESDCLLKRTIETGKPVISREIYIIRSDGEKIPISISTAVLRDSKGNIVGGVETFRDLSVIEELRKSLDEKYSFGDIVSKNYKMREIFRILPQVAQSNTTVLIEGASGTGKELLARAIHNLSTRANKRFVAINCGALPENLLESELFGYKKGAFTGAVKDKPGKLLYANKGTVFLDEIAELPLSLQVKLLRVLQERTIEPLGEVEPIKVDIRIIAATNKNLEELVKQGKFREDLYYRINVINIKLPPLKERKEDIPLLVNHFIDRFNKIMNKDVKDISNDALGILMHYDYPGNVRELENIIEHAFVLCDTNKIEKRHLPSYLVKEERSLNCESFTDLQREFFLRLLEKYNWNTTLVAKELGIHRTTLYRKMKKLNIKRDEKSNSNNFNSNSSSI